VGDQEKGGGKKKRRIFRNTPARWGPGRPKTVMGPSKWEKSPDADRKKPPSARQSYRGRKENPSRQRWGRTWGVQGLVYDHWRGWAKLDAKKKRRGSENKKRMEKKRKKKRPGREEGRQKSQRGRKQKQPPLPENRETTGEGTGFQKGPQNRTRERRRACPADLAERRPAETAEKKGGHKEWSPNDKKRHTWVIHQKGRNGRNPKSTPVKKESLKHRAGREQECKGTKKTDAGTPARDVGVPAFAGRNCPREKKKETPRGPCG